MNTYLAMVNLLMIPSLCLSTSRFAEMFNGKGMAVECVTDMNATDRDSVDFGLRLHAVILRSRLGSFSGESTDLFRAIAIVSGEDCHVRQDLFWSERLERVEVIDRVAVAVLRCGVGGRRNVKEWVDYVGLIEILTAILSREYDDLTLVLFSLLCFIATPSEKHLITHRRSSLDELLEGLSGFDLV